MTHFVIRGAVFLWGRGGVSTGAVRAVTAVTLTVQAESERGTRARSEVNHTQTDRQNTLSYWLSIVVGCQVSEICYYLILILLSCGFIWINPAGNAADSQKQQSYNTLR